MAFNLFKKVQEKLHPSGGDQFQYPIEVPEDVRLFLGNLGLLRKVPSHYLIPDEKYLPKVRVVVAGNKEKEIEQGSLKIFRLDTEWIACLMDGALSIGPEDDSVRKLILSKALAGNYVAEVVCKEKETMLAGQMFGNYAPEEFQDELKKRLGQKGILFNERDGKPKPTVSQNNWCYSGFFMRSSILSAWTGVEVIAKGTDPGLTVVRNLQVVRFEQIHDDLIFCLCEGIISEIEIKQPQEALHFEIDDSKSKHEKKVGKATGVIDVMGLQKDLQLVDSKGFANRMLAKPLNTTIKLKTTYVTPQ